eukprot:g4859.t1
MLAALWLVAVMVVGVHADVHADVHVGTRARAFLRRRLDSDLSPGMSPAPKTESLNSGESESPMSPGMSPAPENESLNSGESEDENPERFVLLQTIFLIIVIGVSGVCQFFCFRWIYRSMCKDNGEDDKNEDDKSEYNESEYNESEYNESEYNESEYNESDDDKSEYNETENYDSQTLKHVKNWSSEGPEKQERSQEEEEEQEKRWDKEEEQRARWKEKQEAKRKEAERKQAELEKQHKDQRKIEEKSKREKAARKKREKKDAWRHCKTDMQQHFNKKAKSLENGTIKKLDVEDQEFGGDDGVMVLARVLPYCEVTLVKLSKYSDKGKKQKKISDRGARALAKCLPDCESLLELRLWGHRITYEGAKALIEVLPRSNLKKLVLTDNPIDKAKKQQLVAPKKNKNGEKIEIVMDSYTIGKSSTFQKQFQKEKNDAWADKETADYLKEKLGKTNCENLKKDKRSEKLDLKSKKLGDEGVHKLVRVLPFCTSLKILILSKNGITDEGAEALAGVLQQCEALQELRLDGNDISDEGADSIVLKLRSSTLTKIDLSSNKIAKKKKKELNKEYNKKGHHMLNIDEKEIEFKI